MRDWLKSILLRNPIRLEQSVGSAALVRMTALALVAIAVAVALVQLRDRPSPSAVEPSPATVDPLASDLARCRSVTPEQLAADDSCRRVWAESRRRFFAPSASRQNPETADPADTGSAVSPKIQDRIPSVSVPGKSIEGR